MKDLIGNGFFMTKKECNNLPLSVRNRLIWFRDNDITICYDTLYYNNSLEDWLIGIILCIKTNLLPIPIITERENNTPFDTEYAWPKYDGEVIVLIRWK